MLFSIDGTGVGSAITNAQGRAICGYYPILEDAGAGLRVLRADWAGDGGYRASHEESTLTAAKGATYLWILPRAAARGTTIYLRAYLRRMPEQAWLQGRTIHLYVDGSLAGSEDTDAGGRASLLYPVPPDMALGSHTITGVFDGDAAHMPTGGQATLSVIP